MSERKPVIVGRGERQISFNHPKEESDHKQDSRAKQVRWRRTKSGVLSTIYHSELRRSRMEGWAEPDYDLAYLRESFLDSPTFNAIYDTWAAAGHLKMLKPSLDRIDASLPYLRTNIQMMSFHDNLRKAATIEYTRTEVIMCDRDGNELRRFVSMTEAAAYIDGNSTTISRACSDQNRTHRGYRWKYGKRRKFKAHEYNVRPLVKDTAKQFRDDVIKFWQDNPHLNANQIAEKFSIVHPLAIYNWKYTREGKPYFKKKRKTPIQESL